MNCDELKGVLAAELYGDNRPEDSRSLKAHLAGCTDCRTLETGWRKASALAVRPTIPLDDAYWIRQKAAIMEKLPKRSWLGGLVWHRLAGPVMAFGVMVSVWGWHHEQEKTALRIAQNMDLLQDMDMLQQLDVVQDLEVLEKR